MFTLSAHCRIVHDTILVRPDYQMQWPRICPSHNYLHACRIGEAQNPGPPCYGDVCMVNPTSLAGKKELFLSLHADVLALAETSATVFVQHEVIQSMKNTRPIPCSLARQLMTHLKHPLCKTTDRRDVVTRFGHALQGLWARVPSVFYTPHSWERPCCISHVGVHHV